MRGRLRAKVKCRVQSEDNPPDEVRRRVLGAGSIQSLDLKCARGFHLKSVAWVVVQVDALASSPLINMNTFSIDSELGPGQARHRDRESGREKSVVIQMCFYWCALAAPDVFSFGSSSLISAGDKLNYWQAAGGSSSLVQLRLARCVTWSMSQLRSLMCAFAILACFAGRWFDLGPLGWACRRSTLKRVDIIRSKRNYLIIFFFLILLTSSRRGNIYIAYFMCA